MAVRHVRAGEVLFSQGEAGDAFYIIERGEIEISVHSIDGRKLTLDVMRDGEVVRRDRALRRGPHRDRDGLDRLRAAPHPARRRAGGAAPGARLALDFIDLLCDRLRRVSDKLEERAFLPVPVRLASRLLYLDAKLERRRTGQDVSGRAGGLRGRHAGRVAKILGLWRSRKWVAVSRGLDPDPRSRRPRQIGKAYRD